MDPVLPVLPSLRQLVLPLEAADPSPRLALRDHGCCPNGCGAAYLSSSRRRSAKPCCAYAELAHDRAGWS